MPLLILSALAALSVPRWVEPEYQTTAVVAFVPSTEPVIIDPRNPQRQNPYSSVEYSAEVISFVVNSSATERDLEQKGLSTDYEGVVVPRSGVLGIEVFSNKPSQAVATGRALINLISAELLRRQQAANLPPARYITTSVLDDADIVEKSVDGQLKAIAAILAAGAVISIIGATLVDDLLLLRRRRQARAEHVRASQALNEHATAALAQPTPVPNGNQSYQRQRSPDPADRGH